MSDEVKEIRVGRESWEMYDGVDICRHIEITNGRCTSEPCEYVERMKIHCSICDETYKITVLVN